MKKSLFALAAVGAFAGAAQAQSSVTVYGILDVGFSGTSTRQPTAQTGSNGVTKQTTTLFNSDNETSSRLGFRGTEDLGGGQSAFFTVEMGLTPQGSNFSSTNNRQSFVGLAQKGLGQFAIGTQYTPVHNAFAATDPGQSNNTVGNVVRPVAGTAGGQSSASSAYTISTTNTLTAQTDRMAGFVLSAQYTQNARDNTQYANDTTNATMGGNTNFTGYGIGINYTWQKLLVTAAYQSFKNETNNSNPLTPTATTFASPGTTITSTSLPNTTDRQYYAGAVYDFGILKGYVNYINRKATSGLNSNNYLSRTAQQIGVRGNVTKTIEGWASAGMGRYQAFGATEPTANFTAWQIGSNYWLSKRTNMYAIYGQTQTSSVSGAAVAGGNSTAGSGASQYALGVRHTF